MHACKEDAPMILLLLLLIIIIMISYLDLAVGFFNLEIILAKGDYVVAS
jgi:hypothetical protein